MAIGLDMSVNAYNSIENGTKPLTVRTLERIANLLDMPVEEFIPSLAGKYSVQTQNIFDNGSGIIEQQNNNISWQELDKSRQETIAAKDEVIAAQAMALEALKLALEKMGGD